MNAPVKIAVVGAGHVGATFAYALVLSGLAAEIVLVDADPARAEGEAMDLSHAVPFSRPVRVRAGGLDDCADAAVVVIAAGVGQRPGETRLALVQRNAEVFRAIVPRLAAVAPDAVLLVATNPVDVLSFASWRFSGFPPERVIGSGTLLDTARFRFLLGEHYGVDARSVHAFIIGEHGDSEVAVWSGAQVAGVPLAHFGPWDAEAMQALFVRTRDAAQAIIARKGATYYAVAAGLMRIVEAVVRDQRTVLPVSSLVRGYHGIDEVYLSLPCVIDRGGVRRTIQLDLDPAEVAALQRSAGVLKQTQASLAL